MTLTARPHAPNSEGELFLHPAPDGKVWLMVQHQGCVPRILLTLWLSGDTLRIEAPDSLVPVNEPVTEVERLREFFEAAGPLIEHCREVEREVPGPWRTPNSPDLTEEQRERVYDAFDAVKGGGK